MGKPKPVFNMRGAMATYNLINNQICYDERLDSFPKIKSIILTHEAKHKLKKNKPFYHLYLDLIDIPKLYFQKELYEYYLEVDDNPTNKDLFTVVIYTILSPFVKIMLIPFQIIGLLIILTYIITKKIITKK